MSDLRDIMERTLGSISSADAALEVTKRRVRTRQRRRAIATSATALLLSAGAIGFLWMGFFNERARVETGAPSTAATSPVEPVVVANVPVGDSPSAVAVGGGSIWVSVESGPSGGSEVARIDPVTAQVIATIPVKSLPGQLAFEDGSLWIGLAGSVQRLDPDTGQVIAKIDGPGTFLSAAPGAVWALDSADSIARIDPATNQIVATVSFPVPASGYITLPPVATPDAVWVMTFLGGEGTPSGRVGALFRVDPTTNVVAAMINLKMAGAFAVGDGAVWVVDDLNSNSTSLTQIDTANNQAAAHVDIDGQWTPFAIGAGRLWLMGGMEPNILVAGLNLSTLELEPPVVVADMTAFEGSGVFDPNENALWIAQERHAVTKVALQPATSNKP